jgi:hypothetical protein
MCEPSIARVLRLLRLDLLKRLKIGITEEPSRWIGEEVDQQAGSCGRPLVLWRRRSGIISWFAWAARGAPASAVPLPNSLLGGRVLRARTPGSIDEEVYALLVTYQVLRITIADAVGTRPRLASPSP